MGNLKEKYLKHKLLINCVVLTLLFFAHCFSPIMSYIVFPFLLLLLIFDNLENGFSYIIFSIPYYLINGYFSNMLYFACIVAYMIKFVIFIIRKERFKIEPVVIVLLATLLIYLLLPFGPYNLNVVFKGFLIIVVFAALIIISKKSKMFNVEFNIKLAIISLAIVSLFSLTYYISPYMQTLINELFTFRFQALFDNPNVLSMTCEFLMIILSYFMISKKTKWHDWLLFGLVVLIGLLTYSKTFLIVAFITILVIVCCKLKTDTKPTLISLAVVGALLAIFIAIKPDFVVTMWDRFFGRIEQCKTFADVMNMVTTYRYDLWVEYLAFIGSNSVFHLFFGYGLGAPALTTLSAHNAYISMLYQLGIVGSLLLLTTLVFVIRSLVKSKSLRVSKAVILPLVMLGLILCVEDALFYIIF